MYTLVTYAETYADREHIKDHIVRGCVLKCTVKKLKGRNVDTAFSTQSRAYRMRWVLQASKCGLESH